MSDLVGNPEDRFSHVAAHMKYELLSKYGLFVKVKQQYIHFFTVF